MPVVFEHPVLTLETEDRPSPSGSTRWVRLRLPDWVNVVALPAEAPDHVLLVRQPRFGWGSPSLEIPGGSIDPGEAPEAAARRELLEETGYGDGAWSLLTWVSSNPALQDNRTWCFLAEGVRRLGPPTPGPGEELEQVGVPLPELRRLLADRTIHHALAVVALQAYLQRDLSASGGLRP